MIITLFKYLSPGLLVLGISLGFIFFFPGLPVLAFVVLYVCTGVGLTMFFNGMLKAIFQFCYHSSPCVTPTQGPFKTPTNDLSPITNNYTQSAPITILETAKPQFTSTRNSATVTPTFGSLVTVKLTPPSPPEGQLIFRPSP